MSCILRVSGGQLDVDALLSSVRLTPDCIWNRGEPRTRTKPDGKCHQDSGVTYLASDADFCDFDKQVEEATRFLEDHSTEIAGIVSFEGVEEATLDFGIELRDVMIHSDILTPRFLRAAAIAGVAVELSHYPCNNEEEPSEQDAPSNGG
jgi:hypothetical protein